ncbi:MAG: cytidylate kinase-like family protein [Leptospiraceae bacterium]|nr:cytidylate kinase-like family protein [Leptospiraceae bacterium]
MNKQLLKDYIHKSFENSQSQQTGPVITISREYGCPGIPVSDGVIAELHKAGRSVWHKIDREALNLVADELQIDPEKVDQVIREKNPGLLSEMMSSFRVHYVPSDVTIKKKYAAIVTALARQGHILILGRGAEILAQQIDTALHVRIIAPREWRIRRAMSMHSVNEADAAKLLDTIDRERLYLRHFYSGEDLTDYNYDLILNAARLPVDAMVQLIVSSLQQKGMA